MSTIDLGGRIFQFQRASDVQRDGIGLEAYSPNIVGGECVAELFYNDGDGRVTFTSFQSDLPVELVQYMVTEGLAAITPCNK